MSVSRAPDASTISNMQFYCESKIQSQLRDVRFMILIAGLVATVAIAYFSSSVILSLTFGPTIGLFTGIAFEKSQPDYYAVSRDMHSEDFTNFAISRGWLSETLILKAHATYIAIKEKEMEQTALSPSPQRQAEGCQDQ